jgi:hypothetical protein
MAGVVAALSVTSDLTRGHPHGEAMRACLLATELARRADLPAAAVAEVYYATLMRFAGCAATSHEAAAALGGDDVAVRARGDLIDATRPAEALRFLASLGHGAEKARVLAHAPRVPAIVQESARADCEVGADLVRRLRLPDGVRRAVLCAFERFDGKGSPARLAGEDIPGAGPGDQRDIPCGTCGVARAGRLGRRLGRSRRARTGTAPGISRSRRSRRRAGGLR